jgi:hypothetical protein
MVDGAGAVAWSPQQGAVQSQDIAIGQTVTFAINSQAGMIANGAPSRVQVLYTDGAAQEVNTTDLRLVSQLVKRGRSATSASTTERSMNVTAAESSTAQDAMNKLNAQWYNAVTTECRLDPSTFQLFQGHTPLGSTSEALWNMLDVVPPLSISNFFNPSQANVFSTDYGAVVTNLKEQNAISS